MTTKQNALANAFAVIAAEGDAIESKADGVLGIVRMAGLTELKDFNAAVRAAYLENGWNGGAGKPKPGNRKPPVPATVKQYVSQIRAAFRAGINVAKVKSFFVLRKDLKAAKAATKKPAKPEDTRVVGLRLVKPTVMIGAPFHDLLVTYEHLEKKRQALLVASVNRLLRDYRVDVPQEQHSLAA